MTRVYVAGSSAQLERVKSAMAALREIGHTVTHAWPELVEEVGEANPLDATDAARRMWAADDLRGVYDADVLWLLMPSEGGFGAAVELGYALAHGIPVVVSGGDVKRSIFTVFGTCYDRDDQALDAVFRHTAKECDCRECERFRLETTVDLGRN